MSLLVVGSIAYDSVETPFGRVEDALGGAAAHFSSAASFFTKIQMVGVVGDDYDLAHLDFLRDRGVDLEGVTRAVGKTFRWKGRYGYNLNEAETLDTQLGVFADFKPDLPPAYRQAPYVFLANIHPELQLYVLKQAQNPKLIAMDTMNFWIEGERTALEKTLAAVDMVVINEGEVRQLSGEYNLIKAARALLSYGPSRLIVKRGEYGALMFTKDHIFASPAYPLESVFDPTGAGDSFAGGVMGHLSRSGDLSNANLRQAIVVGSVMASFHVEDFSMDRNKRLRQAEIHQRFQAFRDLTRFDDLGSPED
ncbi:MAG: PfkB family carbohydrate kinase [Deltaproteobacteria bacterium]|nr:PfkB family carbohydrate kinase [Deltaproteobacteria bacterium]